MSKQVKESNHQASLSNTNVTASTKRTPVLDFTTPGSLSKSQKVSDTSRASGIDAVTANPFGENFFNPKFLGFDLGEVDNTAFDPLSSNNPFNSNIDFEKIRADQQSTISKLGSTTVQFLGKTSLGIVGNIVGSFYGIGESIAEGDSSKK